MSGFDKDVWQLFHTDEDRSEAHDLAADDPQKLEEMKDIWMAEAKANDVLPLNDLQIIGNPKDFETFVAMEFKVGVPPSGQYIYYPGTSEIPERSAANVHNVSYKALAEVELTPDTQGVMFAHGSRFGGHSLFIKDGKVTYAYNFLGIPPENAHLRARSYLGLARHRRRVHQGADGRVPRGRRTAQALHRRRGGRRAGDPHGDGALLALRRGALHRLRQR